MMKRTLTILLLLPLLLMLAGCDKEYMSRTAAEKEMKKIAKAAKQFRYDYARPPHYVDELISNDMLVPDVKVHKEWDFEINWPDEIIAFSTDEHPLGRGITIHYEIPQQI